MFHRPVRELKSSAVKPIKELTAIVPPQQILSQNKRQALVDRMATLSRLDKGRFEETCLNLIFNLINHCQSLPDTSTSYFSAGGGLLDHALHRTEAALSLFQDYVIKGNEEGLWSEEQKLWGYALLSAGLLQGIGKLQMDYSVEVFDSNGQLLKPWSPLLESLASAGSYYLFAFEPEGDDALRCRLNLLVARTLMPLSGFSWIVSNPAVLAVWLALINEDASSAGTLGALLIRANAIAIQRYFNDGIAKGMGGRGGRLGRMSTFVDGTPETIVAKERHVGILFLKWLMGLIESGGIMVNKAPLLTVPGGLLMTVEAFQWFIREHPEYKNWQAVQHGFLSLALHECNSDGSVLSRFEQTNTHQMHNGIVISNYAVMLPNDVHIYHLNTGQVSVMTATELIYSIQADSHLFNRQTLNLASHAIERLTSDGDWVAADKGERRLEPGKGYNG